MKNKKLFGLLAVGALSLATVGAGLLVNPEVKASADSDTRFEMTGAGVRLEEPTGLRFEALVGKDLAENENVTFGVIIFPENIMEMYNISTEYSATVNYHDEINTKAAEYVAQYPLMDMESVPQLSEDETHYTLWGSIANIQYNNLARDWWGVAYAKEGDSYTYAEFSNAVNVRNATYVASAAVSDTEYGYTAEEVKTMKGLVSKSLYNLAGKTEAEADELVKAGTYAEYNATLSAEELTLSYGKTQKLSVSASVAGSDNTLTLGAIWASDDETVAKVDKYGVVTAIANGTATVTATCMGETLSCDVTVEAPAKFTYVPANVYGMTNGQSYTVPMATATEGATVTWVAQDYVAQNAHESFGAALAGPWNSNDHTAVSFSGFSVDFIKITYTLTYGDYTENAYTFLCRGDLLVSDIHGEYVPNMTTSGNMSVSDYELIPGEGGSIRLSGTGTVSGSLAFPANTWAGDNLNRFSFFIYNASDKPVTLVKQWGDDWNLVVPAHTVIYDEWVNRFGAVFDWGIADANHCLKGFSWTASSEDEVNLYFGGFNVNKNAFDGALKVATKAQFVPLNTPTAIPEYTVSETLLAAGGEVSWEAQGIYTRIYDNNAGIIFNEITVNKENKTVETKSVIASITITYTLKYKNFEVKAYSYMMPNVIQEVSSTMTPLDAIDSAWATTGAGLHASSVTTAEYIKGCTTLAVTQAARFGVVNSGLVLGNNVKAFDIVIVNDSDDVLRVNSASWGASQSIQPRAMVTFNPMVFGPTVHKAWKFVKEDNTLLGGIADYSGLSANFASGVYYTYRVNSDFNV